MVRRAAPAALAFACSLHACGTLQGVSSVGSPGDDASADGADATQLPDESGVDGGGNGVDLGCRVGRADFTQTFQHGAPMLALDPSDVVFVVPSAPTGNDSATAIATFDVPPGMTRVTLTFAMNIMLAGDFGGSGLDYVNFAGVINGNSVLMDPFVSFTLVQGNDVQLNAFGAGENQGAPHNVSTQNVVAPNGATTMNVEVAWGPTGNLSLDFGAGAIADSNAGDFGAGPTGATLGVILGGSVNGTIPNVRITYGNVCAVAHPK